jgi:hypothetical protein
MDPDYEVVSKWDADRQLYTPYNQVSELKWPYR